MTYEHKYKKYKYKYITLKNQQPKTSQTTIWFKPTGLHPSFDLNMPHRIV
ncbi:MAG: hypothetical protein Hyperionvirus35_7 [Hyperionvirus sp.]|uniref:Uncharacterized protein n=1 Tax=Hyperionvirus sp. TaxID=2487770 RepID=A0A3G5AEK9_9VIRU|nr:MAG: hypothetical protein Hyperionvirus35_7 [Hyperionvirus sp.]